MTEGLGIHKAICAIKLAIAGGGGIAKGNTAPMGYAFRGIEDFDRVLCGLTAEHHIAGPYPRILSKEIRHGQTAKGGYQSHVFLEVEWTYVCETDGSRHVASTMGEAMDTQDKACNKAMQAARKYADILVFRIPVPGDDTEIYVPEAAPVAAVPRQGPLPMSDPASLEPATPAKTKAKKGAPDENDRLVAGTLPADPFVDAVVVVPALLQTIAECRTFPLLYACATTADADQGPDRDALFAAVQDRAAQLFASAPDAPFVKEGFALVKAMGEPEVLKRAANEAHARFRPQR